MGYQEKLFPMEEKNLQGTISKNLLKSIGLSIKCPPYHLEENG